MDMSPLRIAVAVALTIAITAIFDKFHGLFNHMIW